jgi:hypothetical protein
MTRALCEHPDHIGDRLVERAGLVIRRTEWQELGGSRGRFRNRDHRRECKTCVLRELEANPNPEPTLLDLPGVAP